MAITPETSKGRRTREAILERGVVLACRVGLGGLTIGSLATEVGMSKSGMYAHVLSKEALQLAVLDTAAQEFATSVIIPALAVPRGRPRVLALVDGWIECGRQRQPGGCLFVKASTELDEQPGPVRDRLREQHQQLAATIARIFAGGVVEGHFAPDADPDQFATDLHGVMLAYYHGYRLLSDPAAETHARAAVAALLEAAAADRTPTHEEDGR
ncbi:MAG: transcriptional regulator, TetR family [Actinotalea sp.]|nr:transcriptional regulator, TetR family [Actinotalea sp.]